MNKAMIRRIALAFRFIRRFRVQSSGFRVQGSKFRVRGLEFSSLLAIEKSGNDKTLNPEP
jgi:hypothetical protein